MPAQKRQSLLCSSCKKLISTSEMRCPYCGTAHPAAWWKNNIWTRGFNDPYVLVKSRLGLGMMAVKQDEDAAESLGINALKHKLLALAFSAFLGGLAGGAYAYYQTSYYFNYTFTPLWSLDPVTMAFVGGKGTIIGPIIGAVFFVALKEWLVLNVGEYHLIVFGTLFILVVLFLPGGLVEAWEKIQKALTRRSRLKSSNLPPKRES